MRVKLRVVGGEKGLIRPIVTWKDRVEEYMHERVADKEGRIELEKRDCVDRKSWKLFCHGYLGDVPGGNEALKTINR